MEVWTGWNKFRIQKRKTTDMVIFIMPIVLPGGIELFERIPGETRLDLLGSKTWSSGVIELKYGIKKPS